MARILLKYPTQKSTRFTPALVIIPCSPSANLVSILSYILAILDLFISFSCLRFGRYDPFVGIRVRFSPQKINKTYSFNGHLRLFLQMPVTDTYSSIRYLSTKVRRISLPADCAGLSSAITQLKASMYAFPFFTQIYSSFLVVNFSGKFWVQTTIWQSRPARWMRLLSMMFSRSIFRAALTYWSRSYPVPFRFSVTSEIFSRN